MTLKNTVEHGASNVANSHSTTTSHATPHNRDSGMANVWSADGNLKETLNV